MPGAVGALRAPQREQARPPKRWKHFPFRFGGEDGLARPRSQRPYRDQDIPATPGIAATTSLSRFPTVPAAVGALPLHEGLQVRPPKRWKHSPCVFGGEGGLAR